MLALTITTHALSASLVRACMFCRTTFPNALHALTFWPCQSSPNAQRHNPMNSILNNYLNGNLTLARAQSTRHGWRSLFVFLRDEGGMGEGEARAVADYLKDNGSFQAACDAAPSQTEKGLRS